MGTQSETATHDCCATEAVAESASASDLRVIPDASLPEIALIDQAGNRTTFAAAIAGDTPVAVDFVFTTCTTICPVMTATFARLHETLGTDGADLRLVSISLDPEYDTPAVLRKYAETFGADERWTFLTGDLRGLTELYRRYEVLNGSNKMTHLPFALFRFPGDDAWVRADGLIGATQLAERFREARAMRAAAVEAGDGP